jgi:hypothetical protein
MKIRVTESETVALGKWVQVLQGTALPKCNFLVLIETENETARTFETSVNTNRDSRREFQQHLGP